jgi:hypothetical protein
MSVFKSQDGSLAGICSSTFWHGSSWRLRKRCTWDAPDGWKHIRQGKFLYDLLPYQQRTDLYPNASSRAC